MRLFLWPMLCIQRCQKLRRGVFSVRNKGRGSISEKKRTWLSWCDHVPAKKGGIEVPMSRRSI